MLVEMLDLELDQSATMAIQPELSSGESLMWSGQPKTSVVFHKEDALLIPFSLLWGGFAIFWEAGVLGMVGPVRHGHAPDFFLLWGISFVLVGQYLIWGRFLYVAWLKKRTYYGVTNRRIIIVQDGWNRQMTSAYLDALPAIIKEGGSGGIGILRFGQPPPMWGRNRGFAAWNPLSIAGVPTFVDIADVDSVYQLVSDTRERSQASKTTE
jgi:hypothetical protein